MNLYSTRYYRTKAKIFDLANIDSKSKNRDDKWYRESNDSTVNSGSDLFIVIGRMFRQRHAKATNLPCTFCTCNFLVCDWPHAIWLAGGVMKRAAFLCHRDTGLWYRTSLQWRGREREIYGTKVSGSEGIIRDGKWTILTRERENFKTQSRS